MQSRNNILEYSLSSFWRVSFGSSYASNRAGLGSVAGVTWAKTNKPKHLVSSPLILIHNKIWLAFMSSSEKNNEFSFIESCYLSVENFGTNYNLKV